MSARKAGHPAPFGWPSSETQTGKTLHGFVERTIADGSRICTDDHKGYDGLDRKYRHGRVAHSKGQYANGDAHTNGIESFWAPIKRAHKGVSNEAAGAGHGEEIIDVGCATF